MTSNATAIGTAGSNQATLFAHLVQYFGVLLGCSGYGMTGFPAYAGVNSQYSVHKYMDLSEAETSYFIEQVGLSATSFGASTADVTAVAMSLNSTFGYRCAPAAVVVPNIAAAQQVICQGPSCPVASGATCGADAAVATYTPSMPATAAATSSGSMSATMTGTMTGTMTTGAAASAASGASSMASAAGNGAAIQTAAAGLMAGAAAIAAAML